MCKGSGLRACALEQIWGVMGLGLGAAHTGGGGHNCVSAAAYDRAQKKQNAPQQQQLQLARLDAAAAVVVLGPERDKVLERLRVEPPRLLLLLLLKVLDDDRREEVEHDHRHDHDERDRERDCDPRAAVARGGVARRRPHERAAEDVGPVVGRRELVLCVRASGRGQARVGSVVEEEAVKAEKHTETRGQLSKRPTTEARLNDPPFPPCHSSSGAPAAASAATSRSAQSWRAR